MTPFRHSNIPTADRISNLPDEILCHILSFLPTKHAATTSVISKRWKPVWLLVLTLDLDEETFKDSLSFLHIMHSTIFLRDITLPVHSFRFKCRKCSTCNQNDVNQIVNFALQRGSQNFYLHLNKYYSRSGIELPPSILSCRTLEILKLNDLNVGDISHLVDLHLPSLKILHMTNVSFRRHEHLEKLLLGCPILEDLETKNSFHMQDLKLEKLKALPNLIRARICEWYIPISMVSKAKILSVVPLIWTCLLQHSLDSTLFVFQCLTHLELSFTYNIDYYLRGKWLWLIGILKYSPKLRKLIIQDCGDVKLEESYNGCWKVKEPLIIVPECLLSQLKTCCLRSFKGTKCGFEFAIFIIENSKVLDYMIINSKFSRDIDANSKMLVKLSSCTKGSATCKLLFD